MGFLSLQIGLNFGGGFTSFCTLGRVQMFNHRFFGALQDGLGMT
jgi:hypothetical protein